MYADTVEELHRFAHRIYLRPSWFQNHHLLPHYDLTAGKRALAVRNGAVEQDRHAAVAKWQEIRKGPELPEDAELHRASGDCLCDMCGRTFRQHPRFHYPGLDYGPVRGCDGRYYHL